jgi:hypothetical protein
MPKEYNHDDRMYVTIEAEEELSRAVLKFNRFNSAHEGFAVLLEEVDELKAEVWKNKKDRDVGRMRAEAIQVAAMAMRFVIDVCDNPKDSRIG